MTTTTLTLDTARRDHWQPRPHAGQNSREQQQGQRKPHRAVAAPHAT